MGMWHIVARQIVAPVKFFLGLPLVHTQQVKLTAILQP
jgi:hypothetical protein